jgi:hypothetical protein
MSINDEQQTTVVPDAAPTEYVALADRPANEFDQGE